MRESAEPCQVLRLARLEPLQEPRRPPKIEAWLPRLPTARHRTAHGARTDQPGAVSAGLRAGAGRNAGPAGRDHGAGPGLFVSPLLSRSDRRLDDRPVGRRAADEHRRRGRRGGTAIARHRPLGPGRAHPAGFAVFASACGSISRFWPSGFASASGCLSPASRNILATAGR